MITIHEIFARYGQDYIEKYGDRMPKAHLRTLYAIINCRTEEYGTAVYACTQCGKKYSVYRSCGNRHCPQCQDHKRQNWLETQLYKRLPGHHFLVTFTVPEQLRPFIRSNQKACYDALFTASAMAMKKLSADSRYSGGDLSGFMGVLHTWGRIMQFHPHIHYLVVGGTMSKNNGRWHPSRLDFYLPVKALSRIFKAKFKDELKKKELTTLPAANSWNKDFNVNIQAVGTSDRTLHYLSNYLFKVAITNHRVKALEDGKVIITYKKVHSNRWRTTKLDPLEFMRRFLQHVLPSGFKKVRYYGFMHHSSSVSLATIALLIELSYGFTLEEPQENDPAVFFPRCPDCHGKLRYLYSLPPFQEVSTIDTS